jgi:hypothetical protein
VIKKMFEQSEQKEMQIDSLEVYPIQYHRDQKTLREGLIKRGRKFWNICKPEKYQHDFDGPILTVKQTHSTRAQLLSYRDTDDDAMSTFTGMDENTGPSSSRKEYSGRIIVDAYSFLRAQDDVSASGPKPPLGELTVRPYSDCSW